MKTFAKLGAKTIKIIGADHRIYEAQRLTVAQIETFNRMAENTFDRTEPARNDTAKLHAIYHDAEKQLADLLRPCLPETIAADLGRFVFPELLELGLYLAYGDDTATEEQKTAANDLDVADESKKKA